MQWWNFKTVHEHSRWLILAIVFICAFVVYGVTSAYPIRVYSDQLSNSAPNENSNHTITFTTNDAIPAGGFIRFVPEDGEFTIPALDFDVDNVSIFVNTGSGYVERLATTTASATEDGIAIVTGTSGHVEITLNSTELIPADVQVQILIGNHTVNATSTDVGILNPSVPGTYGYTIVTSDLSESSSAPGKYAIIEHVMIEDVDTRETDPPVRSDGAPTDYLSGTSINIEMSLRTNEFARCRYSTTAETSYFSMGIEFSQTNYSTIHSKVIAANATISTTTHTYYVRCIDDEGNVNIDDYIITFIVRPIPSGTPGSEGEEEGEGSGTGAGDGDADPGDGGSNGGGSTGSGGSGGGSGGGGGGGSGPSSGGSDGGGGFEGTGNPYQSGDAEVIINGYAFPRSKIVTMVDGVIAEETTSSASGEFSVTLSEIARGAYSFGVYGIDKNGVKSSTFSTTFSVIGSRTSVLSNINVMPSIKVTPDPAMPNSTVTVSGYTIPSATVTIENQSERSSTGMKTFTVTSDSNGAWSTSISTAGFNNGTYKVRAKAKQDVSGISTNFSGYTFYGVGEAKKVAGSSDLNRDGKVNLTDFSILLFWWNSDGGASNPPADINQDGRVSLTDFSIMIFNWTG